MLSERATLVVDKLKVDGLKMGDIKKLAKEVKVDHDLALELWSTNDYYPRLLATLIFDKKLLTQDVLDALTTDMSVHSANERSQLTDWLLANQLMKSKKTIQLLESWKEHPSPTLRRLFWYHQARLRWTGQTPPTNSGELLEALESDLESADPEVQWTMNFCAGWIGIFEPEHRDRCVQLGKKTGLYKDERVAKNCTPSYLPEFIRIESEKRNL